MGNFKCKYRIVESFIVLERRLEYLSLKGYGLQFFILYKTYGHYSFEVGLNKKDEPIKIFI
uniref:Uncharacterized protein n=1 Tax=Solanum lycopersicum TaxID=4081 RepID=A0A494GA77_SOLLC